MKTELIQSRSFGLGVHNNGHAELNAIENQFVCDEGKFSLVLYNGHPRKAVAIVRLHGEKIGEYIISPGESLLSTNSTGGGNFTIVKYLTDNAIALGMKYDNNLGLIDVLFIPEAAPKPAPIETHSKGRAGGQGMGMSMDEYSGTKSRSSDVHAAGIAYDGTSDQIIGKGTIGRLNYDQETRIIARVVVRDEPPTPPPGLRPLFPPLPPLH